jgi:acyl-CoA reductase-like NAD-dependent aldehyde dehydrogenase
VNVFRSLNQQYIAGVWRDGTSAKRWIDRNPYSGEPITEFKLASKTDIDEAYRSAQTAQKHWEAVNPYEKRDILESALAYINQHEADITDIIIDELGGTRLKAFFEIALVKNIIREAATYPLRMVGRIYPSPVDGKENRLYRVPAGVVSVISPFNFPFFLTMRSVAPALGAGNGVVLKAHEDTAITGGSLVAKIFEQTAIPKGLLNVVLFDLQEVGDYFIEHPIPRIISFTGSASVGRHIGGVAGKHLKKAILELGGNSAIIVLPDADMDLAINAAIFSRFTHQGQICMSANRVLVHRSLYRQFLDGYVRRVSKLKVGDPRDPQTAIGPLINQRQVKTLSEMIDKAVAEGARPVLRGEVKGACMGPTVFADVKPEMEIAKEEMFGPAVCIMPFDSTEEAIEIANNSAYGLSGAVHTKDVEAGAEVAKRIDSGMVHVNDGTINDEPLVAFGGEKHSGVGRLNGKWALEEFTTLKWVSVQHKPRQYPFDEIFAAQAKA